MSERTRGFCFTLNNYSEKDVEAIKGWSKYKYLVFGFEVGESGTPHLQGYVEWQNGRTLRGLKRLGKRIHWEERRGSPKQAEDYCKKDGKFWEDGTPLAQGERSDLIEIKDDIMNGKITPDDICLENPELYHMYGRTFNKIMDLKNRKKFRTWMTKGEWIWGPTGVGKSHRAFEGFDPDTHYVWVNDNGWWDGYVGQKIVIINDFRGEIKFNELLCLIDKWPHSVRRRNREPFPFLAEKVIITTSMRPGDIYGGIDEDRIDQLLRRVECIRLGDDNSTEVLGGNTRPRVIKRASPE